MNMNIYYIFVSNLNNKNVVMKKRLILVFGIGVLFGVTFTANISQDKPAGWNLLQANIEALANGESGSIPRTYEECLKSGGNWNMASVCTDSGFESSVCKISGEISIFGMTLKGNYEKGQRYSIPWARYSCQTSAGNCCIKQGLYSGERKLA